MNCETAAFLIMFLKFSQHGFSNRQIRLSIELPFSEALFVDTRYSYNVSLRPFLYKHVEVELRIFFFFFAPVQISLHVTLIHYNSPIPIIMITYKLQKSVTVSIIIATNIFLHADTIIVQRCRRWLIIAGNNFVFSCKTWAKHTLYMFTILCFLS